MGPLVSVIIPCYNQGDYIHEAIQSVLASTYSDLEIIVVNDGSTDELTNSIIANLAHPKIKVVSTLNQGLAEARNTGIKASQGKYILPLDADDKISPTYIIEAVNILNNNPDIKVVTCNVRLFGAATGRLRLLDFSMENLICQNTMVCSSVYRRKDYDQTHGYNPNMKFGFEDWDFWLSLLKAGGGVNKIPEEHFFYRIKRRSMLTALKRKESDLSKMRYQIYMNHKELYSSLFFNPLKSFEYDLLINSREYKLGKLILRPIRLVLELYRRLVT